MKKLKFIITIRYKIPLFLLVGPFSKRWGGGLENFGEKLKFLGFFQLRSLLLPKNVILEAVCSASQSLIINESYFLFKYQFIKVMIGLVTRTTK